MTKGAVSKRDERFRTLLEQKKLRVTSQRLLILRTLSWSRTPVSFPDLVERIGTSVLDRATIWRNLVGLTEAGILLRSTHADGVLRYELPDGEERAHARHPHLVCVDCGVVTCVPANAISIERETAKRVTEIQLRGRCGACDG